MAIIFFYMFFLMFAGPAQVIIFVIIVLANLIDKKPITTYQINYFKSVLLYAAIVMAFIGMNYLALNLFDLSRSHIMYKTGSSLFQIFFFAGPLVPAYKWFKIFKQ